MPHDPLADFIDGPAFGLFCLVLPFCLVAFLALAIFWRD